jgi:gamma-F420-2:alpha-L-glutamate ligase
LVEVFGKIVAAVKRTAPAGEFRSNYSLGGEISAYTLSDSEIETVNKVIELFDFSMAGIDFIIDKNGAFVFNEIEDVVGSRMLYNTHPDMDILDIFFRKLSE